MADYYTTNAYSRSNSNANGNANNPYGNNPYGDYSQSQSQNQSQTNANQNQQPSMFSNFAPSSTNDNSSSSAAAGGPSSTSSSIPSLWNPVVTAAISNAAGIGGGMNNSNNNEAMYKIGQQFGQRFLDEGTARLIPGLETFMSNLRVYFAVDNGYVKRKMMRVLFSFFCKNWSRVPNDKSTTPGKSAPSYALPINDDNAPDLYIPFMSLITYVLLCALCYGTAGQFDPEVIINVTSKCIFIQLMEVCFFKFGIYMMSGGSNSGSGQLQQQGQGQRDDSNVVSFLDLFAFTGYKYLALTCNMIIGFSISMMLGNSTGSDSSTTNDGGNSTNNVNSSFSYNGGQAAAGYGYGSKGYYIMYVYTASSICYFILKTMANNIQKNPTTNSNHHDAYYQQQQQPPNGPKREFVILGFALSQFGTLWFLGQTKFLN